MSHFTVAVITKDGDYEKALAPFDENIEVEPYIRKTVKQLVEHVKERKESHDKCVAEGKDDSWFDKHYGNVDWSDDKSIHEAYVKLWNDSEMFDEEGNELSTYNPKAKWDWYSLGGRWIGSLKLKEGIEKEKESEPSLLYLDIPEDGYVDHARVKDIDWTPDPKEVHKYTRIWEIVVEDSPIGEDEDELRTPVRFAGSKEDLLEEFKTKENYIDEQTSFFTYALLHNGEWLEPGRMGWWGMSTDTKESRKKFREVFKEIISKLDPEDYISVVDCHI